MGIRDITGVFSRYFIVGFFIPAFFGLGLLKLALSHEWVPKAVRPDSGEAFAVLGAVALLIGLVLLGLRDPILYNMSGYRFTQWGRPFRTLAEWMRGRLVKDFLAVKEAATKKSDAETLAERRARNLAEWKLGTCFPNSVEKVLPMRLGNTIRAWEDHARTRWSLETVVVWPRINTFLSEQESKLHADAETDVAFFLNGSLALTVAGLVMALDGLIHRPHELWLAWIYVLPFVLAYLFYRAAVNAAERWGGFVRASIDLHRFELYEKLGVMAPRTAAETEEVGLAVNLLLLYGDPPPDRIRTIPSA